MANRSYLYSLDNRPKTYADRPETLSGLSEWAYFVPFSYRVLMSGDPQLCASLVSDGFDDEPANQKTKIYAISSDFELGFSRLKRLFSVIRPLTESVPVLLEQLRATETFLEAHRNRYLLLETLELDMMSAEGGPALRASVEAELNECRRVGAAIDALPADPRAASAVLEAALERQADPPFDVFFGLRLDERCDDVRDGSTEKPLGVAHWYESLFYSLWNRTELERNQTQPVVSVSDGNGRTRSLVIGILCIVLSLFLMQLIARCR